VSNASNVPPCRRSGLDFFVSAPSIAVSDCGVSAVLALFERPAVLAQLPQALDDAAAAAATQALNTTIDAGSAQQR